MNKSEFMELYKAPQFEVLTLTSMDTICGSTESSFTIDDTEDGYEL